MVSVCVSSSPASTMMLLLLAVVMASTDLGRAQTVTGKKLKNGLCSCAVNSTLWSFPARRYEAVLDRVERCEEALDDLQDQVQIATDRLPLIQTQVQNLTARLQPFQYLHYRGLYVALSLRELGRELVQLETDVGAVHEKLNNAETKKLSTEVVQLRKDVKKMQTSDNINMKTVKEKLRYLKNGVESCRSIPKDFRGQHKQCLKGLLTNISDPVVAKIAPEGNSYPFGSWGKQALVDSPGQKNSFWIQRLFSGNIHGSSLRVYQTHEDFMAAANHEDFTVAPSYSHPSTIEGPSAVLYGEALYYNCYRSADVCRYDLKNGTVIRATLPGPRVGFNNKFPYCYYDCTLNSDVDVEADETGLWALYATYGNHGNLVVSRLAWDPEALTLNVTQTWETRLFKKAVSNAFMACGVMYATRFVDDYHEEVFYAFDTATGKEDNSLSLPLEKVSKQVASLSYNPTDRRIYMYNYGYLLAYQAHF